MGQMHARDMEELFLYANADSTTKPAFPKADEGGDAFCENLGGPPPHDGWLLLSEHLIDKEGAQPDTAVDLFRELLDALPSQQLDRYARSEWRFYVNSSLERRYREELGERMTALGDRALFENAPVFYQGIPVVPVPSLRLETRDMVGGGDSDIANVTDCLLVHPMNLVAGFRREVQVDVQYQPRKGLFELTLSARATPTWKTPAPTPA